MIVMCLRFLMLAVLVGGFGAAVVSADAQGQAVPPSPSGNPASGGPPAGVQPNVKMPPAVVGVVDLPYVMQTCLAARSVRDQADKQWNTWQVGFDKRRSSLIAAKEDLDKQQSKLTQEVYSTKSRLLLTQRDEWQQDVSDHRRQLDESYAQSIRPVEDKLLTIIGQLTREHGLNVVLHRGAIVVAVTELDLTAELLQRMDKEQPAASFKLLPMPKKEVQPPNG